MKAKNRLVCGVGVNDSNEQVSFTDSNGKVIPCKIYQTWKNMLWRCHVDPKKTKKPTYAGCSVCNEWLRFSNFKSWAEMQPWEGKELDKDIIYQGNKVYSPETCVFIDSIVNTFVIAREASRGDWPIGVSLQKNKTKFRAICRNPFLNKLEHIGFFSTADEAHHAWKKRKHEHACRLADMQIDERVAKALRARYL